MWDAVHINGDQSRKTDNHHRDGKSRHDGKNASEK